MTKTEFLDALDQKLLGLSQNEIEERLIFYSEMIDDRMEEGLSEEDAVAAVGDIDEIARSIMAELSLQNPQKKQTRRLSGTEIALLIIGFPLWFPLIIAGISVCFSLYVSAWSVVISLWAVSVGVALGSIEVFIAGIFHTFGSHTLTGIALIGLSLILAGFSVFAFYGCLSISKLFIKLTKWLFKLIKGIFIKKETEK